MEECGCDNCMNPLCWTEEQWLEWNDMGEPSPEAFFTLKHQLYLFEENTDAV
jgi:hypothetical protein